MWCEPLDCGWETMVKAGRMKDGRQLFHAINEPWSRTAEVRERIDEIHLSSPDGRKAFPLGVVRERTQLGFRARNSKSARHQHNDVR